MNFLTEFHLILMKYVINSTICGKIGRESDFHVTFVNPSAFKCITIDS